MTYHQQSPMSHPEPQPAAAPRNGLGTAGFVLGLVGMVFSPIPLIGVAAWPLTILGLVLSAVGLSRALKGSATNRGLAVAGVALSIVGLVICVVWLVFFTAVAVDEAEKADRVAVVEYKATGDAENVELAYDEEGATKSETVSALPWQKQVKQKGLASFAVTAGESGGSVSCEIRVDGKVVHSDTDSGPFAVAVCLSE